MRSPERYGLVRGTPEFGDAADEVVVEALLLRSMRHDNVARGIGVTKHREHGHVECVVTERASGGSLEAWLAARGGISVAELLRLVTDILRALTYLHSRDPPLVHGSVKPTNMLAFDAAGGGVAWKLDMGVAKALHFSVSGVLPNDPLLTAPDVVFGACSASVDLFSLFVTVADVVVRHMDVPGFSRVSADVYRRPVERRALLADASARLLVACPQLERIVHACCSVKAKDRMSSERALAAVKAIMASRAQLPPPRDAPLSSPSSSELPMPSTAAPPLSSPSAPQLSPSAPLLSSTSARSVSSSSEHFVLPPPAPPACASSVADVVDIGAAVQAMAALEISALARVRDRMGESGLPGADFLRVMMDEGVKRMDIVRVRQHLGITAAVPSTATPAVRPAVDAEAHAPSSPLTVRWCLLGPTPPSYHRQRHRGCLSAMSSTTTLACPSHSSSLSWRKPATPRSLRRRGPSFCTCCERRGLTLWPCGVSSLLSVRCTPLSRR
jgi:hypothetical protein